MSTAIRNFTKTDIPFKVKWINDDKNNQYLHYDLPLREDKTLQWFESLKDRNDRVDYTITYDGEPAGIIGLLNIDNDRKNAEYYVCVGEEKFKGKGVAKAATELVFTKAFKELGLKEIYLYTETENVRAQKFFEKSGFKKIKLLKDHLFHNGKYIDRFLYNINLEKYFAGIGV